MGHRTEVPRRRLLTVGCGLGVALSGCIGQKLVPNPTNTSTSTAAPPTEADVEVPPCPERPTSLTRETALQFVVQFEKAYAIRQTLQRERDESRIVSISITVDEDRTVTKTSEGWIVRFTVIGPSYVFYPDPNATTTLHADPGLYEANYFISDRHLLRAESTAEQPVDPRTHGSVAHCPPA